MLTNYDHVQELRAELAACRNRKERKQIAAELKTATAEQARLDAALDAPPP